jgi:putative salt-induced outer membrane protein
MSLSVPLLSPSTLLLALLLTAGPAPAQDQGDDGDWSGRGELGLASASGNTDSQTLNAKVELAREDERSRQNFGAHFQYGRSDGVESAYRYQLFGSVGYEFGRSHYFSGSLRHQRDHYATNEYQWALALSLGLTLMESEDSHLNVEIGPGYRFAKLQDVRVHKNEGIVRGNLDYSHQLTETTRIYDTLLVEAGRDNTYASNDMGVQVQMSEALALKAGLEVRHNTDVLPGIENTDTLTTVNLVYGF